MLSQELVVYERRSAKLVAQSVDHLSIDDPFLGEPANAANETGDWYVVPDESSCLNAIFIVAAASAFDSDNVFRLAFWACVRVLHGLLSKVG